MSNIRNASPFVPSPKRRKSVALTPSIHRKSLGITNSPSEILFDENANDDEVEKRERILNRLQQLKSIAGSSASTPDRRKSLNAFAGLTNQQITEHYTRCIQLSAENKINIKNAFNLQLIDCMTELLKKKDSDMNNFQMASCTLDASTKIYGYRVDSVHADTLKMAGGLGRTKDKPEDGDVLDSETNEIVPGVKKKTKAKRCVYVETNLKNINLAQFNLEYDVDPLFKKMASQFNEGACSGSNFLNTLSYLDDTCSLVLDSETVVWETFRECSEHSESTTIPPIPERTDWLICPTFAPFEFSSWKITDEDEFNLSKNDKEADKEGENDDHAFDINAIPEPIEDFNTEDPIDPEDFGNEEGVGTLGEDTILTLGAGACRQGPLPPPPQFEIVHLKGHLSNAPLEYSYFNHKIMSAWAGPGHWKFKSLTKALNKDEKKIRSKLRKDFNLDYTVSDELEKHFAVLRASTKLSQITIKRWCDEATTLPVDLHYDPAKFNRLYLRPEIVVRKQEPEKSADIDDSIAEYSYDNQNDKENYCPPVNEMENSGQDYEDEVFSQTMLPSQTILSQENHTQDFLGNNLVQAPNKVNLISIGYARTAKKVDMKRLKTTLWTLLQDDDVNKENKSANVDKRICVGKKNFSKIYDDLRPRVPAKMAEDLSVSLAFIALLHLANENSLRLSSLHEMGDFVVSQD